MHTLDQLRQHQQQAAQLEQEVLEDITAKAKLLGFELVKIGEDKPVKTRQKKPAKYRSPNGQEWSGKGKKPGWLLQALEDGKSLEDFAV